MGHAVDPSITRKDPLPGVFELPRSYRRRGGGDGEAMTWNKALQTSTDSYIYCVLLALLSLRSCVSLIPLANAPIS